MLSEVRPTRTDGDVRGDRVLNTTRLVAWAGIERGVPWLPSRALYRLRRQRLRTAVARAFETVPFYREAMLERGLCPRDFGDVEDLAALPLVDGHFVQRNLEQFVSKPYASSSRMGFHSSGSESGIRRLVYWDDAAILRRAARAERHRPVLADLAGESWRRTMLRELAGGGAERGRRVLGRLGGDAADHARLLIFPTDWTSRTHRSLWSDRTLVPRHAAHYHLLSPHASFDVLEETLRLVRPRVVFSFGSYVDEFLRHLADTGRPIPVPRLWVYAGDMVTAYGRELAERLHCRLYSVYSSVEAGDIGFQCERREGFHLNVDTCAVRVVDDVGRAVAPGVTGDVVISTLENRAMSLLNYRQGDRGALARGPCPCGRSLPVLERLEGRRSEIVTLADGRRISKLALEGLLRGELRAVRQLQLVQRGGGELGLRLVPFAGVDREAMRVALLEKSREVLGHGMKVTVDFDDEIPRTPRGKLLGVVSGK